MKPITTTQFSPVQSQSRAREQQTPPRIGSGFAPLSACIYQFFHKSLNTQLSLVFAVRVLHIHFQSLSFPDKTKNFRLPQCNVRHIMRTTHGAFVFLKLLTKTVHEFGTLMQNFWSADVTEVNPRWRTAMLSEILDYKLEYFFPIGF